MNSTRVGMPSVVLRCDGSEQIGFGHISRCLTLAHEFHNEGAPSIRFVYRAHSRNAAERLNSSGFPTVIFDVDADRTTDLEETLKAADEVAPSIIITDSHELSERYYEQLVSAGPVVLSIDDYAGVRYASTLVLNHHINARQYTFSVWQSSKMLLGPSYFPLRPDLKDRLFRPTSNNSNGPLKIFVSLGGMPEPEQVLKVAAAIHDVSLRIPLMVTLLPGLKFDQSSLGRLRTTLPGAHVLPATESFANFIADADIAIVSGGVTAYEAAAFGAALLVIPMGSNQLDTVRCFRDLRLGVTLGLIDDLEAGDVSVALKELVENGEHRRHLGRKAAALVDGRGSERIIRQVLDAFHEQNSINSGNTYEDRYQPAAADEFSREA